MWCGVVEGSVLGRQGREGGGEMRGEEGGLMVPRVHSAEATFLRADIHHIFFTSFFGHAL